MTRALLIAALLAATSPLAAQPLAVAPSGTSERALLRPAEDLPPPGAFLTHGYNFDWEEGSWGARGFFPLPLNAPVGIGGGIDYFPEDEFRSLTALGADLTYHLDMDLLGNGQAYGGFGPRLYLSRFESGNQSETDSEFGFGAVLGATYPIGPLAIYGDIGTDNVFDEWSCFTRIGIGLEFGERE